MASRASRAIRLGPLDRPDAGGVQRAARLGRGEQGGQFFCSRCRVGQVRLFHPLDEDHTTLRICREVHEHGQLGQLVCPKLSGRTVSDAAGIIKVSHRVGEVATLAHAAAE